jgi:anti-sigma B factor antagonist
VLHVRTSDSELITIVSVAGDIDQEAAPELRRVLVAGAEHGRRWLVVNMSAVTFLDSSGLAVLVRVARSLGSQRRLALANVPVRLQRVLRDTAMDTLMDVHCAGDPWPWP